MTTLIKGGRLIDPATKTDMIMDIIVKDGIVAERGENLAADGADDAFGGGSLHDGLHLRRCLVRGQGM